jgi:hypothetical protein
MYLLLCLPYDGSTFEMRSIDSSANELPGSRCILQLAHMKLVIQCTIANFAPCSDNMCLRQSICTVKSGLLKETTFVPRCDD